MQVTPYDFICISESVFQSSLAFILASGSLFIDMCMYSITNGIAPSYPLKVVVNEYT